MVEVPNRILFSEMKHVTVSRTALDVFLYVFSLYMFLTLFCCDDQRAGDLAEMITRVIREGLEGLVLKDIKVS